MHEKDYVQPPTSVSSAEKSIGCILPLLAFVAIDLMCIEETFFTLPVADIVPVNLRQISLVPFELDCFKLTEVHCS